METSGGGGSKFTSVCPGCGQWHECDGVRIRTEPSVVMDYGAVLERIAVALENLEAVMRSRR